jgi:hypothetical protein
MPVSAAGLVYLVRNLEEQQRGEIFPASFDSCVRIEAPPERGFLFGKVGTKPIENEKEIWYD